MMMRRVIPTHRVVVSELGKDKAEAEPLAWQGSVVVALVVPLVTQCERLGQRLQLGGDVRLGDVLQLSPPAVRTGVHARLQQLHGRGGHQIEKCNNNAGLPIILNFYLFSLQNSEPFLETGQNQPITKRRAIPQILLLCC